MIKKETVLIVRPNYDRPTYFSNKWADEVIDQAKKSGLIVVDLNGRNASREKVEHALKDKDPIFVIHYGHGKKDALFGHDGEPIIDLENYDLLKGKYIYSLSCDSGTLLGSKVGQLKNSVYLGWNVDYKFSGLEEEQELFKHCANIVPQTLFRKGTVKTAKSLAKVLAKVWINHLIKRRRKKWLELLKDNGVNISKEEEVTYFYKMLKKQGLDAEKYLLSKGEVLETY